MKFIKYLILILPIFFSSCERSNKSSIDNAELIANSCPEYKIINKVAKKVENKTKLELYCYGYNCWPSQKKERNEDKIYDFYICYNLCVDRKISIKIEEARKLLVSVTEAFIKEANLSKEIKDRLAISPLTEESLRLAIYFIDQDKIDLGHGVCEIAYEKDEIRYVRYDISEYYKGYQGKMRAKGKHYTFKTESYEEAKEIVMSQGGLIDFNEKCNTATP